MPLNINSSNAAFDVIRNLELTTLDFTQAVERLSSGLRINSAADDPSGLAISEGLLAQSNAYDQVQRNAQDSVSLLQAAQSGMTQIESALQRLDQLAVEASNDTLTSSDRQSIQSEVVGLLTEIDQVAHTTNYNGRKLLDGTAGGAVVTGGGSDITAIQVQPGVLPDGTSIELAAATVATKGAIEGQAPSSSTFTGGGSVTIAGPTGLSQTFTSYAGEDVSTFIEQVNQSGIGVTAFTNSSDQVVLASNDYGIYDAINNPTGAETITATGQANDVDFGSGAGAALKLIGGTTGSVDASNNFTAGATAQNASVTLLVNGTDLVGPLTLQGVNSDQLEGSDLAAGFTARIVNPGSLPGVPDDTFTVSQNTPLELQVGPDSGETVSLAVGAQDATSLGVDAIDLTTQTGAESAQTAIQDAIDQLAGTQSSLGALQNTLTDTQNSAAAFEENLLQARSNLVDANIPEETLRFAHDQILLQAGTAVLAQANQIPGLLVSLLTPGRAFG